MTSIDPIFTDEELDAEIAELWPIEFLCVGLKNVFKRIKVFFINLTNS